MPEENNVLSPVVSEAELEDSEYASLSDIADSTSFENLYDPSLGNVLENLRQLHVDCNAIIVDSSRKYSIYVSKILFLL